MRLTIYDQIIKCPLNLFFSLLQAGPTVVDRDDRESKILHILES